MKVMCIGQAAYDITLPLDHFPVENKKTRVNGKVECGGGSSSNCSYLLAKWGLDTYFAGIIGNDYYGQKIIKEYESVNVNMKYLQVSDKFSTTSSYIVANTTSDTRTILTSRCKDIKMEEREINDEFDYLLFDGYEKDFAMEAVKKNPKAIKILDAGSMKEATVELTKVVDYVVCSHDFANEYSGVEINYNDTNTIVMAYEKLKEKIPNNIIITLEEHGCFTKIGDEYKIIPSIKVKPVDSTGAGDIFHGAFLYFLSRSYNLETVLYLSNITGALSVEKIGSRFSIPTLEEVINKYNDTVQK